MRVMRLLTACAVIGFCAYAMNRGWSIVEFAEARARIATGGAAVEDLRPWTGAPGLASLALAASLGRMAVASDIAAANQRKAVLTDLLGVRPMSAMDWLSLAGMRLATGQPYPDVLGALAMSSVTGPNENAVMQQRAMFGLMQWEALPAEARRQTIRDLSGAIAEESVGDRMFSLAALLLKAKPEAVRSEIAGLLGADGVPGRALVRLGL